jgi:Domain of unknown function (DUF4203)
MLPTLYEPAAAVLLFVSGVLACLAGYRLFKIVLGIYGFLLGAAIASSMLGVTSTGGMVIAAIFGGVAGAIILVLAYYVGIALLGAGLGVLVAHVVWTYMRSSSDPPLTVIAVFAVLGAMGSMLLQRYVIIVATAFGGAWTAIIGALTLGGDRRLSIAASSGDVWILYPLTPSPRNQWVPIAWLVLGLIGTAVQLGITGRRRKSIT